MKTNNVLAVAAGSLLILGSAVLGFYFIGLLGIQATLVSTLSIANLLLAPLAGGFLAGLIAVNPQ